MIPINRDLLNLSLRNSPYSVSSTWLSSWQKLFASKLDFRPIYAAELEMDELSGILRNGLN